MPRGQGFFLFVLLSSFWFFGCASLTQKSRSQVVVVKSQPLGAEVRYQGKRVGMTPLLLALPRGRGLELEVLQSEHNKKTLILPTQYRWGRSFAGNLVLFTLAPFGWGFDLLTGSAWDFVDPIEINWDKNIGSDDRLSIDRIAIAPPQSPDEFLSDQVGLTIVSDVRKRYPNAEVLQYGETLETFLAWEYDFDSKPSWSYRTQLFKELGVSHLVESEVLSGRSTQAEVRSQLTPFTNEAHQETFALSFDSEQISSYADRSLSEKMGSFVRLIPNTISVEFASVTPSFKANGSEFVGVSQYDSGVWGDIFRYLGALNLSHLEKQSQRKFGQAQLKFVPSAYASWSRISYPGTPIFQGIEFNRLHFAGGFGPQIGWKSSYGYAYFQMIPALGYTGISWEKSGQVSQDGRGSLSINSEFGYSYFFSDRFVGKFFVRRVTEDIELWQKSMALASDVSPLKLDDVGYSYGGVSFGYHFTVPRFLIDSILD
ncbi:MAG: hypothetical protein IPJ71_02605 [Bdellovibrionales bacterium]|nr:hypothetical protein [Bdellovibrionales bacterium]